MQKLFTSPDRTLVGHLQSVLEGYGIATVIKNEFLGGGIGDLPAQECWPELWVIYDADEQAARQILSAMQPTARTSSGSRWKCRVCGEWLDAQFDTCWRCAGES